MRRSLGWLTLLFCLAGCAGGAALTASLTASATLVPSPTLTKASTDLPTSTLRPTATATRTPPVLPGVFQSALQNPVDPPHTYISNTCQYLQDKWSSNNSAPGTVVMPIMFHSIMAPGDTVASDAITQKQFTELMGGLESHGFKGITTSQLAGFLYHNAKIPPRSVILIADDRRSAAYFNQYFRPWWVGNKWPVVSAWISAPFDTPQEWQEHEELEKEGWVDNEAHGVVHFPIMPYSTNAYVMGELQGSIDAFKLHFNKMPIAFIWPGGNFTTYAVKLARQLGYQLGFTANPRGPLMFNWIPLGDQVTPVHGPSWWAEGPVNDPLMLLPRYWDKDAVKYLDKIIQISQDAAAYAQKNQAAEKEYYDSVCAPTLGPIP